MVAKACIGVTSENVHEWISLMDARSQCSMRICLLPGQTHAPAWNRLLGRLPSECAMSCLAGGCHGFLRRVSDFVQGESWRASALAFMAARHHGAESLSATLLSLHGVALLTARRLGAADI